MIEKKALDPTLENLHVDLRVLELQVNEVCITALCYIMAPSLVVWDTNIYEYEHSCVSCFQVLGW